MTNGMTVKYEYRQVTYDIHLDGSCCSGFSNHNEGPKEAIFHLFRHFTNERRNYWAESHYKKYHSGHKVIAPMLLVEWDDD